MPVPGVLGLLVHLELMAQVLEHPQVVHGMDLAGDHLRQRAHAGPGDGVRRHQRGHGVHLVEVFDDRHRLRQARAVVQLQHRHQAFDSDVAERGPLVFALGQVHRHVFVSQPLERERDAHTERGRGSEVVVELHGRQG